jgi:hypothetical protein
MFGEGDRLFVLDVPRTAVEITLGTELETRTLDLGCGADCHLLGLAPAPGGLYYTRADGQPERYSIMFKAQAADSLPVVLEELVSTPVSLSQGENFIYVFYSDPAYVLRPLNKQTGELEDGVPHGGGTTVDFHGEVFSGGYGVQKSTPSGEPINLYLPASFAPFDIHSVSTAGILVYDTTAAALLLVPTDPGPAKSIFTTSRWVSSAVTHGDHVYFVIDGCLMRKAL